MNPAQLLQYFDRISEAPDAIPRLRRFILDLAVRGKLVEQDPNDEPASELLKRIHTEKARRIKLGEIRAARGEESIEEVEKLYQLPSIWIWVRLSSIGSVVGGGTPPSGDFDNFADGGKGVPWLTPADLGKHKGLFISHGARDLSQQGLTVSSATLMPTGSVLFTSRAPIGYTAIASNSIATNQGFKSVIPYITKLSRFVALYFQAFAPWIDSKASGTTFREVSAKIVASLPFPLPPIAEQHRIVAKVDELMALCDQLEAAKTKREQSRDRLVAASLQRLNQPADDEETFREDARFTFNHLPRITTRPAHIKQLRQTILNLAVRGKLAAQDPNDEPASELLNRFYLEKEQLLIRKELRQSISSTESIDRRDEVHIPSKWAWAKCSEVFFVTKLAGFEYTKYFDLKKDGDIPVIRAQNVRPWKIDKANLLYMDKKISELLARSALTKPCILLTFIGAGIGDVALFEEENRWHLAPNVAKIEAFNTCEDQINLKFLLLMLISPFGRKEIFKHMKATAQPSISMGTIRDIDIPLPPLPEQHRIVAKVDELMALCDHCLLYTSPSPRDRTRSRMPSSA